uniref:Secreted protein n=1 Tax=Arundo donax TaxID=35708 RepID=A0A0A9FKB8_ARUDO
MATYLLTVHVTGLLGEVVTSMTLPVPSGSLDAPSSSPELVFVITMFSWQKPDVEVCGHWYASFTCSQSILSSIDTFSGNLREVFVVSLYSCFEFSRAALAFFLCYASHCSFSISSFFSAYSSLSCCLSFFFLRIHDFCM